MSNVYLPKTSFNIYEKDMEDEVLSYWDKINLNKLRSEKRKDCKTFVIHDGPPYSNGAIHIGHAENKIWKDILNKIFWQAGYDVKYIMGWDAHGLPIENAVEKKLAKDGIDKKTLSKQEFWNECADFANYWVEEQKKGFKKLAVFGDYDNPYITFKDEESIGIMECIHKFVDMGYLIQKYRPVLWSYAEKTALAYAEVEYKDKVSNSIYFSFPIVDSVVEDLVGVNVLIWTTTPWTLPANEAVCYNSKFTYVVFKSNSKKYCVEKHLFENLQNLFDEVNVIKEVSGIVFDNAIVDHCIKEFNVPGKKRRMIHGDHVENERGTGFVHTAPSHGEEDFDVCKKNHVEIIDYLDADGAFVKSVPIVCGMNIKVAEGVIIDLLKERDLCFKIEEITHSYPHSWRSKAPLIYRLTKQWFLNMEHIKSNALKIAKDDKLCWFPIEGKNRFTSMLETREDWCISRQRTWGVPLGIFVNVDNGKVLDNAEFLKKTRDYLLKKGIKNWSKIQIEDIDPSYSSEYYKRVDDIVDIWFESGATHHFVLKKHGLFPADIYLEGSDQHRGWFQSSLLISATQSNSAPWKNLITHGFCLDAFNKKMSKSIGNVVDPLSWDIDTLRVFFASLNLTTDVALKQESIVTVKDMVFRFKNTLKFLLGNLAISKDTKEVEYDEMPMLEQWILHRFYELDLLYDEILNSFYLNSFINKLYEFCALDLSSFYFDVRKDTLYCDEFNNFERRSVISLFRIITPILMRYLSNFMPYSMERAWFTYLEENGIKGDGLESIHIQDRVVLPEHYKNDVIAGKIKGLRELKKLVNENIEILRAERKISTSYEVKVTINHSEDLELLKKILIVSAIEYGNELKVEVLSSKKCPRCKFLYDNLKVNGFCDRCERAMAVGF